jgi:hypothetical protein
MIVSIFYSSILVVHTTVLRDIGVISNTRQETFVKILSSFVVI